MNRVLLFLLVLFGVILIQNGFFYYNEQSVYSEAQKYISQIGTKQQEHFTEQQQCVDPVTGQVRSETVAGGSTAGSSTRPSTQQGTSSSVSSAPPPEGEVAPNRVFYVKTRYSKADTERVCSMYGANVATIENLQGAYNRGANWCSWGWLADGSVAYPVQKKFWRRVERTHKGFCGPNHGINRKMGVNSELEFGVLCYGVPPPGYKDPRHVFPKPKRTIQRQQDECMERKARRERERWEREQRRRTSFVDYTIPIE